MATRHADDKRLERSKEESLRDIVVFKVKRKMNEKNSEKIIWDELEARKSVLCKSSDVFKAMFKGGFNERPTFRQPSLVQLDDTCKEHFADFLRFLHTGQAEMTLQNATGLLYLGHKYMVHVLRQLCYNFIYSQLNADNFESVLHISHVLGSSDFESRVMLFYKLNPYHILTNESFVNVTREGLLKLLAVDKLNLKEIELFRACMRWADAQLEKVRTERQLENDVLQEVGSGGSSLQMALPSRREVLGENIIRSIRFPCMTNSDFVEVLKYNKLLTENEVSAIKRCINKATTVDPVGFFTLPRQKMWEVCVERNNSMQGTEGQKISVDDVAFDVKSSLFLTGVGVHSRKNMNMVVVELSSMCDTQSALNTITEATKQIRISCSSSQKISFDKPTMVQPHHTYQLKVTYFKDDSMGVFKEGHDKVPGSAYRVVQSSKDCKDVQFKHHQLADHVYYSICQIFFVKS